MDVADANGKDPTIVSGNPNLFGQRSLGAVEGTVIFNIIWSEKSCFRQVRFHRD